jgi:glycogen(starch) synthase
MRVWVAPSAYAPHVGGVEEVAAKLAGHLADRGHQVVVVTNRHPASLADVEEIDGVEVRRLRFTAPGRHPYRVLRHLRSRPATAAGLRAVGPLPDVINVHCGSVQMPALARFARRNKIPLVLSTHGETAVDDAGIYQRSAWLRQEIRRASEQAAALTACSTWTASAAAAIAPRFREASVILNGIDAADWTMPPPGPEPVIAAWGRMVDQKGFDLLLKAFIRVRGHVPTAQLILGGDGPRRPVLEEAAVPGVCFLGRLSRGGVRDLLSIARVVAVPSRCEPFGIVALEALAAGRGLVYSPHGGLREAAGGCGRIANPEDSVAFADALLAELAEPTPATAAVEHARSLSWSRAVDEYEQVLIRAAVGRGRQSRGRAPEGSVS